MKTESWLESLIANACVLLMLMMCFAVSLQIVTRYLLPRAPGWTEELGRYLLPWLVALGTGAYLKKGSYRAAIDVVTERLPKRVAHFVNAGAALVILSFLVTLTYNSVILCIRNTNVRSAAMELPMTYVYLGVLVTALLMLRFFIPFFFEQVKGIRNKA